MTERKGQQKCPAGGQAVRVLPSRGNYSVLFLGIMTVLALLLISSHLVQAKAIKLGVLMASNTRQAPVDGLKSGLAKHAQEWGHIHTYNYLIKNADGDRRKLAPMAAEIIASRPDVAIACGGIEADALLTASAGTTVPVVFLSVSSSVDRGIVASMVSSGNNFTGIDTNDTALTAKRLWFIKKMLPEAKNIFCFNVPSVFPSAQSLEVARDNADELGLTINSIDVESDADIRKATDSLSRETTDVILLLPVVFTDKALRSIILPKAMSEKIPIFGYGMTNIESGAFASYAGSRFANGEQAARLIHKVINGTPPADIPIETPEKLELILNKAQVAKLGLKIPNRVWRMADKIVDIENFESDL